MVRSLCSGRTEKGYLWAEASTEAVVQSPKKDKMHSYSKVYLVSDANIRNITWIKFTSFSYDVLPSFGNNSLLTE